MFSPIPVGCLFVLFMVSCAVQKLIDLIRSCLFTFAFISITLWNWPKENIAVIYVRECFASVVLLWFMVSCLLFKFLSHFEFIFMYNVRECSNFIALHATLQFSQHHLLPNCLFSIVYFCLLCWRLIDCRCVSLFLGSMFCSSDPYISFCANTMLFWLP